MKKYYLRTFEKIGLGGLDMCKKWLRFGWFTIHEIGTFGKSWVIVISVPCIAVWYHIPSSVLLPKFKFHYSCVQLTEEVCAWFNN